MLIVQIVSHGLSSPLTEFTLSYEFVAGKIFEFLPVYIKIQKTKGNCVLLLLPDFYWMGKALETCS